MLEAVKGPDGEYRVPWYQAWRVTHFTKVVDPETGERLFPNHKALSVVGSMVAAPLGPYMIGGYWIWEYAFDRAFTVPITVATALLMVSHVIAGSVALSVHVTFSPAKPGQAPPATRLTS